MSVCVFKQLPLTFIRLDKDAFYVARLFMVEGTVWLLAACRLVLPVTRDLLSIFLF